MLLLGACIAGYYLYKRIKKKRSGGQGRTQYEMANIPSGATGYRASYGNDVSSSEAL